MNDDPMVEIEATIGELRVAIERAREGDREVREAQLSAKRYRDDCDRLRAKIKDLAEAAADPPTMVMHSEPRAGIFEQRSCDLREPQL